MKIHRKRQKLPKQSLSETIEQVISFESNEESTGKEYTQYEMQVIEKLGQVVEPYFIQEYIGKRRRDTSTCRKRLWLELVIACAKRTKWEEVRLICKKIQFFALDFDVTVKPTRSFYGFETGVFWHIISSVSSVYTDSLLSSLLENCPQVVRGTSNLLRYCEKSDTFVSKFYMKILKANPNALIAPSGADYATWFDHFPLHTMLYRPLFAFEFTHDVSRNSNKTITFYNFRGSVVYPLIHKLFLLFIARKWRAIKEFYVKNNDSVNEASMLHILKHVPNPASVHIDDCAAHEENPMFLFHDLFRSILKWNQDQGNGNYLSSIEKMHCSYLIQILLTFVPGSVIYSKDGNGDKLVDLMQQCSSVYGFDEYLQPDTLLCFI